MNVKLAVVVHIFGAYLCLVPDVCQCFTGHQQEGPPNEPGPAQAFFLLKSFSLPLLLVRSLDLGLCKVPGDNCDRH